MIYLDNAATTPLDPEVLEAMIPYLKNHFGNPSSIHAHGRETRSAIEKARKTIAGILNASPAEFFFTSGGTEADNTAIVSTIATLQIKHAVTSPLEHHAVLHCLQNLQARNIIHLSYVKIDDQGHVDHEDLKLLLEKHPKSFVSLMHANNEIGTLNDLDAIAEICASTGSVFHSDTVQTIGHYTFDLQKTNVDFVVGSAHKFHGPKGIGFLYIKNKSKISPFIHGGSQERNMRGGTENVYGIVGLAKALEIADRDLIHHQIHVQDLKQSMMEKLQQQIPEIKFNGDTSRDKSLYTVLNVSLPASEDNDMLLFNLDIHKISASGGSACTSGSEAGSHVLEALHIDPLRGNVRFSFSKLNTMEEVDAAVKALVAITKK